MTHSGNTSVQKSSLKVIKRSPTSKKPISQSKNFSLKTKSTKSGNRSYAQRFMKSIAQYGYLKAGKKTKKTTKTKASKKPLKGSKRRQKEKTLVGINVEYSSLMDMTVDKNTPTYSKEITIDSNLGHHVRQQPLTAKSSARKFEFDIGRHSADTHGPQI